MTSRRSRLSGVGAALVLILLAGCGDAGDPERAAPRDTAVPPDTVVPPDTAVPPEAASAPVAEYDTVFVFFSGPPPGPGADAPLVARPRPVPDTVRGVGGAMAFAVRELLAGPEGSAADSVHSWFSDSTAGMLRDVVVVDGSVVVDFHDFRPIIPNAASSAGALMLLDQLRATVFQFPEAERVELRIEGDCAALMEWLQMECTVFRRSGYEPPRGFREVVTRP